MSDIRWETCPNCTPWKQCDDCLIKAATIPDYKARAEAAEAKVKRLEEVIYWADKLAHELQLIADTDSVTSTVGEQLKSYRFMRRAALEE